MNTKFLIIILSILTLLSGCSSLSKSECLAIDWAQVGLEDGKNGLGSIDSTNSYQESCSKHDVEMDMNAYQQGHEEGRNLFCQPENGFELGKQGYQYTVICPHDFDSEYRIGYQFYIAYSNIAQLEKTLNTNASTINKLEAGLSKAYFRLNNDALSVYEENQILQNIDSMEGQIETYELSTQHLEPTLSQSYQQLQNLKTHYGR